MSDKHRARKKRAVEPIDWEELERAPNLGGMLSFLNVSPEEARQRHEAAQQLPSLEDRAGLMSDPVSDTPGVSETADTSIAESISLLGTPPVLEAPGVADTPAESKTHLPAPAVYNPAAVLDTPPILDAAEPSHEAASNTPGVPDASPASVPAPVSETILAPNAVFNTPPVSDTLQLPKHPGAFQTTSPQIAKRFRPFTAAKVARGLSAQDAHTLAEQILYSAMYRSGTGTGPYRDISAGNRSLMAQTGLSERAVQLNLKSLELKLSIETIQKHDPDTNQPKTYRVYSQDSILERRRAAGLEWIQTKRGGGVRLVAGGEGVSNTPPVSKTGSEVDGRPPTLQISRSRS